MFLLCRFPEDPHLPACDAVTVRRFPPVAELRLRPPWAVIRLSGEIDLATAPAFRAAAEEALRSEASTCLVDLREVTFLDSGGLAVLALLLRRCSQTAGQVRLVGAQGPVRTALRITGLLQAIPEQAPADLPAEAQLLLAPAGL
jgi:anti-sigma B factor antagonist